ncbi:MAG: glycosyltransferase family 2 protein, partial [Lentisphaerae bacterium]|nr:glycosyltransferase family 2 protein [Lentisphaerota bacterium]
MTGRDGHKFCTIVPSFQEEGRIGSVVRGVRQHCDTVVVVDDGSSDGTGSEAAAAGAVVLTHETNRGKGASLNTGLEYARSESMEFVITMDGDGQHDPGDIPGFVDTFLKGDADVLVGTRMDNPVGMPLIRRITNHFMSWLLSRSM